MLLGAAMHADMQDVDCGWFSHCRSTYISQVYPWKPVCHPLHHWAWHPLGLIEEVVWRCYSHLRSYNSIQVWNTFPPHAYTCCLLSEQVCSGDRPFFRMAGTFVTCLLHPWTVTHLASVLWQCNIVGARFCCDLCTSLYTVYSLAACPGLWRWLLRPKLDWNWWSGLATEGFCFSSFNYCFALRPSKPFSLLFAVFVSFQIRFFTVIRASGTWSWPRGKWETDIALTGCESSDLYVLHWTQYSVTKL